MKAKFVKESLLEFERGKTYDDVKDILEIGDQRVRDKTRLKRFAEENGYAFEEDPRNGTLRVTVPMEIEERHTYDTSGDYMWAYKDRDRPKFKVEAVQYTITYPDDYYSRKDAKYSGWADAGTPISLRKRWLNKLGRGLKQQLMGRFRDIKEAIRRIEQSIPKERAKSIK